PEWAGQRDSSYGDALFLLTKPLNEQRVRLRGLADEQTEGSEYPCAIAVWGQLVALQDRNEPAAGQLSPHVAKLWYQLLQKCLLCGADIGDLDLASIGTHSAVESCSTDGLEDKWTAAGCAEDTS